MDGSIASIDQFKVNWNQYKKGSFSLLLLGNRLVEID